jgi:RNA polymerase sigma factor (sigma-70 family)
MSLSPSEVNDLQLINQIKSNNDSTALCELANRHTGIYIYTIEKYSYVPKIEKEDLLDHKLLNFYNYAKDYDPSKNMKFSSYVTMRLSFECKNLMTEAKKMRMEEISPNIAFDDRLQIKEYCQHYFNVIFQKVEEFSDTRFVEIFKLRHGEDKEQTWKVIGSKMNLTTETVRKIYLKNIKILKNQLKKNYEYKLSDAH